MTRLPSQFRAHEEHKRDKMWMELISSSSYNDRYMFHYIELTLQGHIRYMPVIIPNSGDILTLPLRRIPRLADGLLKTPSKTQWEKK